MVNSLNTMWSWPICFAHDRGRGQSLEILASTSFWSIWDWTTIFKCDSELSVILVLQSLHCLHDPIDQDSAAVPSLITSLPIVKTHESFSSTGEALVLSEHIFPLDDMACHLTRSLSEAQWVEQKLLSLEWISFLGTSFLTTLSPSTREKKVQNPVTGRFSPVFLLPRTPLGHLHLLLLTNVSDEHPPY